MNTQIKVGDTVVRKKECQHNVFWQMEVSHCNLEDKDAPLQVRQIIDDVMHLEYKNTVLKSRQTGWTILFVQESFDIVPRHTVEEECDDC